MPRALKPLARQSDHRLVELSRAGDERAFEALVRRHAHELRIYAGRLLGAEGRAEDALQHALMSAWVALRDRDATVANPRAWLYGIVQNSAVTVLRRARHAHERAVWVKQGRAGRRIKRIGKQASHEKRTKQAHARS